jgi:hypothetical protein
MRRNSVDTRRALGLPMAFFFLGVLAHVIMVLWLNDGHFTYRLDDPYIHLALAENVAHGHYGLNAAERSAPASSILWPFLLAPLANRAVGEYIPLLIGILASIGSIVLVANVIGGLFNVENKKTYWAIPAMVIFFHLLANTVGLVFTGMEHTLQVFISLALVVGLFQLQDSRSAPWWLGVLIVLGPLVRYENFAFSVPALGYLVLMRHYRLAAISGTLMFALVGGFSLFLHALGLTWLPTSVIEKSCTASVLLLGTAPSLSCTTKNVMRNASHAWPLYPVIIALVYRILYPKRSQDRWLATWMMLATIVFLVFGKFGGRFATFVWASALLMIIQLYRDRLAQFVLEKRHWKTAVFAVLLLVVGNKYVMPTLGSFLGANNIYEQQYQMYRFVKDYYKAPVAVNDVGRVSYRNDGHYILDLFGVANKDALAHRLSRHGVEWMNELSSRYGVRFAMIFDPWFRRLPPNWTPVGKLYLGKRRVSTWGEVVTFYALDPETDRDVRPIIASFVRTLPPGVTFETLPIDSAREDERVSR